MNYQGKTIWITGASSGIGEAFARALYKEGANLILSSRREGALKQVKESLGADKSRVFILPLDLTQTETFPEKTEQALKAFGQIDMLMNNGGVSQRATVAETEMDTYRRLMEINYFGAVGLTKQVLPHMVERQSGHIVVTSSVAGKIGTKQRSGYAASKHAVQGFFNSLRQEMYEHNVAVTLLCPGFIKTNISKNALTGDGAKFGKMGDAHKDAMTADEMVKKVMPDIKKQKEEIYVTGFKEGLAIWVQRISPTLLNKILKNQKVT
ncbi:SDR family oxidoreductase [Gracilimonas mengyeensis]|uniref:Short-chain dehydrogenase n=1 Tax=Gracilimonas mengyeensis TaxID=1302730 RepID=A0A521CV77_9BACT|nr:SDR family oxidoreductase [Gracilimonas mengyeensis]SMO62570.1 Short-chain dehydrogenase [Gracilimonas mengyeensis]